MPWCPVCKNEYVEGMKICADCKVELVDELEDNKEKPITFGTKEEMQKLNEFLQYNQVTSGIIRFDEKNEVYEICVSENDRKRAEKLTSIFIKEEALKNQESEDKDELVTKESENISVYENKSDKAENFKTSAYTLILVGAIGMLALILSLMKVITFQFGILTYIVMGVLFLIFIGMGVVSFLSYKKISKEAVLENNLTREIKSWCVENLKADDIDECLCEEEMPEDMKYFKRTERMKKIISETYLNLEEGFLDALVEELYPNIFE